MSIEGNLHRKIQYSDDFKDVIHNNPGVIKIFRELAKRLAQNFPSDGLSLEENNVKVSLLGYFGDQEMESVTRHRGEYFKVEIHESNFGLVDKCVKYLNINILFYAN